MTQVAEAKRRGMAREQVYKKIMKKFICETIDYNHLLSLPSAPKVGGFYAYVMHTSFLP